MGLTARGAWEVASAGTVALVAVVMLALFLQDRRQAGSITVQAVATPTTGGTGGCRASGWDLPMAPWW